MARTKQPINLRDGKERFWYAFRVLSQDELKVSRILRDAGFSAVVPVKHVYRRRNRYAKSRTLHRFPLMYGYVLMAFETPQIPWHRLMDYSFLRGVIGIAGRPAVLEQKRVEEILMDEDRGHFTDSDLFKNMRTYHEYNVGDTVEVDAMGFDGVKARVISITPDGERAVVRVPFFNSERDVEIPVDVAVKSA
jgi:transcription antitermination factor NusG